MKKRTLLKTFGIALLAAVMLMAGTLTSFADDRTAWDASEWVQMPDGWRYMKTDGTMATNEWLWITDPENNVSKCYFFNSNSYLVTNAILPDGTMVDENGAWVVNGVVQTRNPDPIYRAPYGGEIRYGYDTPLITLSTYMTNVLDLRNGANNFPNRTLLRGDEGSGTLLYLTMNNGTPVRIEIDNSRHMVTGIAAPASMIFSDFPAMGIEQGALYENMSSIITSTVPMHVSSYDMAQYFDKDPESFEASGMIVVADRDYNVSFMLTPGNDGCYYIYPDSPVYIYVELY